MSLRYIWSAIVFAILLVCPSTAFACSFSNVNPGQSTTTSVVRLKPGNTCNISMDLQGWEIHRITIVERPRLGTVEVRGVRGYQFTAGRVAGTDRFIMEFDSTGIDWYSGARQQRSVWRLTLPVEIQ